MSQVNQDITKTLISDAIMRDRIGSILHESVILDNQFNFISVSQNILESTGYESADLIGNSISVFSSTNDLKEQLSEKLLNGFFEGEQFEIKRKGEGIIKYGVSGFYLGLIANVNGVIVLKLKNLEEIKLMHERLEARTADIDDFVYLSAHALRGPLATMKGLINLVKGSNNPVETDYLIKQLDIFADKLDDKLHKLIYFAESDKEYESTNSDSSLQSIGETLNVNIKEASIKSPVLFHYETQEQSLVLENGGVVLGLLRNLVLFLCEHQSPGCEIQLCAHSSHNAIEFVIRAKGFLLSDSLREKLASTNFGYSEILNHQELINCYAAKKIIYKLRGDIYFSINSSQEVAILMNIPRGIQLSGF